MKEKGFLPATCVLMIIDGVVNIVVELLIVVWISIIAFFTFISWLSVLFFLGSLCAPARGILELIAGISGINNGGRQLWMAPVIVILHTVSAYFYVGTIGSLGLFLLIMGIIFLMLYIIGVPSMKRPARRSKKADSQDGKQALEMEAKNK